MKWQDSSHGEAWRNESDTPAEQEAKNRFLKRNGKIAQLVRALGSYPGGPRFDPESCYFFCQFYKKICCFYHPSNRLALRSSTSILTWHLVNLKRSPSERFGSIQSLAIFFANFTKKYVVFTTRVIASHCARQPPF